MHKDTAHLWNNYWENKDVKLVCSEKQIVSQWALPSLSLTLLWFFTKTREKWRS
jgi:hypothetical protein